MLNFIPFCDPVPKLQHYEVLQDIRESRIAHRGQVHVTFTIDRKGHTRDVKVLDSTDDWFNDLSIKSIFRWRYEKPLHTCRATLTLKFEWQD